MLIMTVGAAPFPIRSCVTLGVESIIADFEMISLQPWMNGIETKEQVCVHLNFANRVSRSNWSRRLARRQPLAVL